MIRATLTGSEIASAAGITVTGPSPVLRLCRALIDAGHDPAESLEAYRGDVLCLKVRSIGEAAGLEVTTNKSGTPVLARQHRRESAVAAPPVRFQDPPATTPPDNRQNESTGLCSPGKSRAA